MLVINEYDYDADDDDVDDDKNIPLLGTQFPNSSFKGVPKFKTRGCCTMLPNMQRNADPTDHDALRIQP